MRSLQTDKKYTNKYIFTCIYVYIHAYTKMSMFECIIPQQTKNEIFLSVLLHFKCMIRMKLKRMWILVIWYFAVACVRTQTANVRWN